MIDGIEKQINQSGKRISNIFENAMDLIIITNNDFEIEFANEVALSNLLGYEIHEIKYKRIVDFLPPEEFFKLENSIENIINKGKDTQEYQVKHQNGETKWLEVNTKAFKGTNEEEKALLICRDISARKRKYEFL